jgi:hypothetical protein
MHPTFFIQEKRQVNRSFEDVDVDGRTALKFIFKKEGWRLWTKFVWLRRVPSGGVL